MLSARFDPRAGGRLWAAVLFVPAVLHAFLHMIALLVASYVVPGFDGPRAAPFVRLWGRIQLWMYGIRCEIVGRERVQRPGPALVTFNHQSVLDLALLARIWPDHGCVLYKQEFHRIPIMGRLMRRMGMIPIDRANRRAAFASLDRAAERVQRQQAKLLVAPEGTRSRLPGLAPFKRGPFHLAAQTHAPLIPLVMHGVRELWPHTAWLPRRGVVRLEFLEPLDTSAWTPADVDAHAATLRAIYLEHLPDGAPGQPVAERDGAATP